MARVIALILLLAGALGWFEREQRQGATAEAEAWFLDFLVANSRDALGKEMPAESKEVVLVEIKEEEKAEYSVWPPAPLDYIMILRRLTEHEPQVLAVAEPLRWDKADTEFVNQLRNALVPFPSVVLGVHLTSDAAQPSPEQREFFTNEMPVLPEAEGDQSRLPKFTHVSALSDWSLRIASQAGFSSLDGVPPQGDAISFVATDGKRLVPSLAAQAVTLFRHVPYVAQRLRFGTGARLSLGNERVIPLNDNGTLPLTGNPRVPAVNALELMTPDLGDETSKQVSGTLGKGKVVVLGNGPGGMALARAIATALAMPQIRRAPDSVVWGYAGLACLFCLWQLRCRRLKAVAWGIAAWIIAVGVCVLVFQTSLLWWPPLSALLVISCGTLFCFVWPPRRRTLAPAPSPAPEPEPTTPQS